MGLDLLHQHAAEDVGPGVVVRHPHPRRPRRGGQSVAVRPAVCRHRRQQVDAGEPAEGLGDGDALRRGERIASSRPRNDKRPRPAVSAARAIKAAQSSISVS